METKTPDTWGHSGAPFWPPPRGRQSRLWRYVNKHLRRSPQGLLSKIGASFGAVKSMHGIRDAETNHWDQWMTAGIAETFQLGVLIYIKACYIQNLDGVWTNIRSRSRNIQFGLNPRLLLLRCCQRCCKGHVMSRSSLLANRFHAETEDRFAFTWYRCEISYRSEILAPVQEPGWTHAGVTHAGMKFWVGIM